MAVNKDDDLLVFGGLKLRSRVFLGSARYPSAAVMMSALKASGTELCTVSLRRVDPSQKATDNIYAMLKEAGIALLPNTAGCFTAKEAVTTARMAREALDTPLIKLEVIADEETLLPEPWELVAAAEELVADGFIVLPYCSDDPVLCQRLEDIGCAAVMPLAAPIGSGLGIRNPHNLRLIKSRAKVPVVVDAGLGTASDVAQAFELGCDAVLLNSAVARAQDPVAMARAVGLAAAAGRSAFFAGRIPQKDLADSASPLQGRAWR